MVVHPTAREQKIGLRRDRAVPVFSLAKTSPNYISRSKPLHSRLRLSYRCPLLVNTVFTSDDSSFDLYGGKDRSGRRSECSGLSSAKTGSIMFLTANIHTIL